MKVLYSVFAVLLIFLMQICIRYAKRKNSITSKPLVLLHITVLHGLTNYIIYLWIPNQTLASVFYSFYNINVPWLIGYVGILSLFLGGLADKKALLKKINLVLLFTSVCDAMFLLGNVVFQQAFILKDFIDTNNVHYFIPVFKSLNVFHFTYCYVLVLLIIGFLVFCSRKTSFIYKKHFISIIIELLVCIVFNTISIAAAFRVDFSIIIYGFITCFASYMTLHAIPSDLINNMMTIVSENINNGIACYDIAGHCVYLNKTARLIFKVNKNGMDEAELYRKKICDKKSKSMNFFSMEDDFMLNDEYHHFFVEYKDFIDSKGKILGCYIKFNDRTNEIRLLHQEIYNGSHDTLTGLYNRRAFFEKAAEELQKHPDVEFNLVATDIENFKLVNDLFGTDMGDRILQSQAKMLSVANYDGCVHGRISGDKFAMLIPREKFNQRLAVINTRKIQNSIPELKYKIHMYLGVYEIVDKEENVQSMYDKACSAIDSIHGDYELTLAFYDSSVIERQHYEKTLINSFESSLQEKNFTLFLQPLVDAKNGKVLGAESLCRWNHPSYGMIEPDQFLTIIEKTDAIFSLDSYNWRCCCALLKEWKDQGKEGMYISANISSMDFYYGDIYEILTGLVKEYDIDPACLRLEITETAIIKNIKRYKNIIKKLREYGFLVEMDDFGSGYASISTLKDIPMDVLKLDMGFLSSAEISKTKTSIIKLIVQMAKKLNMTVVAEGVETEEQSEIMKNLGCDILQGFYFARPMSINAFELKYMRGNSK